MTETISRRSLYDAVWSEPVYKVAKRFGITAHALAKKCRNHDIPIPERGYWSRMLHGGVTTIPSLPFKEDGDRIRIGFKQPMSGSGAASRVLDSERKSLMTAIRPRDKSSAADELVSTVARSLNQRLMELRNCGGEILTVSVSALVSVSITSGNISRVACLVDELILLLEGAGYELKRAKGGLAISIGDELMPIAISELVRAKGEDCALAPGDLVLIIGDGKTGPGVRQRFADSAMQRVEDLLPLVIGSLAAFGACAERRRRKAKIRPEIERGVVLVQKEINRMSTLINRFENAADRPNVERDVEELIDWTLEAVARRALRRAEAATERGPEIRAPKARMCRERRA